jgi:hypothetical protein
MATDSYTHVAPRPIGDGKCGNLRDASIVVGSAKMCASYAASKSYTGFCMFAGSQCFTSADFSQDYEAGETTLCNEADAMECYTFDADKPARRMTQKSSSNGRRGKDLDDVSNSLPCMSCKYVYHGESAWASCHGSVHHMNHPALT